MSCYVLDHVLQECLHEKAKVLNTARGKTAEAKVDIYANCWVAVNAWIESRLCKQKGASIGGFASFAWEMMEKDGETHCRPIFIIADDFVKTHRVRRPRIHHVPQLTPVEEINYSMLAIKFSKSLTKDMVFAGLRDIFRKIGEFISRGYELEISFTFGVLRAKENRVKFVFNQTRLLQILPENLEPGVYAHTDQPMQYIEQQGDETLSEVGDVEESRYRTGSATADLGSARQGRPQTSTSTTLPQIRRSQSEKPPLIPTLSLGTHAANSPAPQMDNEWDDLEEADEEPSSPQQYSRMDSGISQSDGNATTTNAPGSAQGGDGPNLQELMAMIEFHRKNKHKAKSLAKDRVMSQAFQRCLEQLEHEAVLDDRQRFEEMKKTDMWKSTQVQDRDKSRLSVTELRSALSAQMEANRQRMDQAKADKKNTMMAFILPDNAGMAPSPLGTTVDEHGNVINGRQRIAKDLARQIAKNELDRSTLRRETQNRERDQMARLQAETELYNVVERSRYLEKQKALVEAWERDGHVRNIRKLQPLGQELVQDYIGKHLQDPTLSMSGLPPSMDQSLTKSIGYDPRKGRV